MAALTSTEYADLLLGALDTLKDDIIAPNSAGSDIETRYISSIGFDEESWLGQLRDETGNVDIWLMTVTGLRGLSQRDLQDAPVGGTVKPVNIVMDYYADYRHGTDGSNTERAFLRKLFAVDWALELKRGCLANRIYIDGWDFRVKLRRWEQATTHWASGVINLRFDEIPVR